MRRKGIQDWEKPVSPTLEVAPETPVWTLEGVCDRPQVAGGKRLQDRHHACSASSMIELRRRKLRSLHATSFAINYARLSGCL